MIEIPKVPEEARKMIDGIPPTQEIRERLAELCRAGTVLRKLLKLAMARDKWPLRPAE